MKDTAECYLHEKQLYSQLMRDCVALINSLNTEVLLQDRVQIELKKEEQLTSEIKALLQKQICILLQKLRSGRPDMFLFFFVFVFYFQDVESSGCFLI